MDESHCPKSFGGLRTVKFYPDTKRVFDEENNYLGNGEMVDGILVITHPDTIR